MKLNRFAALVVIALLVVGATGFLSNRSLAKSNAQAAQQAQTIEVEDPSIGPDTDTIEKQVGEQVEDGQPDAAEATRAEGLDDDGPDERMPSYTGSIAVDESATEGLSEADESAALAGQATIGADQARAAVLAANPGATVVKVELDNENGYLVYSVELKDGSDVKIDAGTGAILHTESGGEDQE